MSYFLLAWEEFIGDWFLVGAFDDHAAVLRIANKYNGYQIIEGKRIQHLDPVDEEEFHQKSP